MEPELESFEITDEDLNNEFNPFRPTFRQSKHQATYGIWADEDSDDEGRPAFGKKKKKETDLTSGINFISGGIKEGDKITKKKKSGRDNEDDPISDSDEEESRPQLPSSFGSQKPKRQRMGVFRAGIGAEQQQQQQHMGNKPRGRTAGNQHDDDDYGSWERHTKGIGAKLLAKMGHVTGKGLGTKLQGISSPVEAFKRKGKAAVGFYGSERTDRSLKDYPRKPDSDVEEEEEFKQQLSQWKKGEGEKKKKPKYVYKTVDEVMSTTGTGGYKKKPLAPPSHLSKVKVIDMTGKEQRVLSGYHALHNKHDKPDVEMEAHSPGEGQGRRHFDMPELMHNLDLLVNMAEEEIVDHNRQLRYEKDLIVNLRHEDEKMKDVCEQEEKQINRLKEILDLVEKCQERSQPGCPDPISLEEAGEMFKKIQEDYYEEYKIYDLSTLAVAMINPMMEREYKGWEPLRRPRQNLVTMKNWKAILEDPNRQFQQGEGHMDPYERLIWDVWMPHIRVAVRNEWSVRACDPMIEVLEAWMAILPPWVMSNILEQLVLPKLQSEVEEWNPLTDTMPIHAWLHPWLPLMGERLEPLYAPIRHKLANALNNWHPSDPSAKMILEPWKPVFKQGQMDAFLVQHILPKLGMCMGEFIINPHHQQLDCWTWVMSWLDMVPRPSMVSLLEKHFFPRWIQVLCHWLSSNPNYEEVTKWYMGWKSMLSEALVVEPAVKDNLNKALDIMNRAVSGQHYMQFQPGARESVAYLTTTERRRDLENQDSYTTRTFTPPPQKPPQKPTASVPTSAMPASFKDLIERKAMENGLTFVPLPGKFHEAKQQYKFGKCNIYIDRGVVFLNQGQNWVPCSIGNLVDRAT